MRSASTKSFVGIWRAVFVSIGAYLAVDAAGQLFYPLRVKLAILVLALLALFMTSYADAQGKGKASENRVAMAPLWLRVAIACGVVFGGWTMAQQHSLLSLLQPPLVIVRSDSKVDIGTTSLLQHSTPATVMGPTWNDYYIGKSPELLGSRVGGTRSIVTVSFAPNQHSWPRTASVEYYNSFLRMSHSQGQVHLADWSQSAFAALFEAVVPPFARASEASGACGLSDTPAANTLYASGLNLVVRGRERDMNSGIDSLAAAVRLDPGFVLARCELANTLALKVHRGWYETSEIPHALLRAMALAEEARRLCPESDFPSKVLGLIYQTDYQQAEMLGVEPATVSSRKFALDSALEAYEQAIRVNGRSFAAYSNLIALHGRLGRLEEAERAFASAVALLPTAAAPYVNMADVFLWRAEEGRSQGERRRHELRESLDLLDNAARVNPRLGVIAFNRAMAYAALGEYEDAWSNLSGAISQADYDYYRLMEAQARKEGLLYGLVRRDSMRFRRIQQLALRTRMARATPGESLFVRVPLGDDEEARR